MHARFSWHWSLEVVTRQESLAGRSHLDSAWVVQELLSKFAFVFLKDATTSGGIITLLTVSLETEHAINRNRNQLPCYASSPQDRDVVQASI